MKKILTITAILISTYGSNSFAGDNFKFHDNGASVKLGDVDTFGVNFANDDSGKLNETSRPLIAGRKADMGLSYNHPLNKKLNSNVRVSYSNDLNDSNSDSGGMAMFSLNYKLN